MKNKATLNHLPPKAFTPRTVCHRTSTEPQEPNDTMQYISNSKSHLNILADSCKIIFKSREDILGKKQPTANTPYVKAAYVDIAKNIPCNKVLPFNELSTYKQCKVKKRRIDFGGEEVKKMVNSYKVVNNDIKKTFDFNEKLSANELSKDVIYGYGGVGFKNYQPKLNSKKTTFHELKKEILERKQRMRQYQEKIIKSIDTKRDNSFEENNSAEQITQSALFTNSQTRIRTKPDTDRRYNVDDYKVRAILNSDELEDLDSDKEGLPRRPYIGKRTNKKNLKNKMKKQYLIM